MSGVTGNTLSQYLDEFVKDGQGAQSLSVYQARLLLANAARVAGLAFPDPDTGLVSLGDGALAMKMATRRSYLTAWRECYSTLTEFSARAVRPLDRETKFDSGVAQSVIRGMGTPSKAYMARSAINALWKWAKYEGLLSADAANPFDDVTMPSRGGSKGYEPWPVEMIEAMIASADPVASTIVMLAYDTGQRIGDVRWLSFGNFHQSPLFEDIMLLKMAQEKTGQPIMMRCTPRLRVRISEMQAKAEVAMHASDIQIDHVNVLSAAMHEKMYQLDGGAIGNYYRMAPLAETTIRATCNAVAQDLGFKPMALHGLRKSATVRLIDAGATEAEVMAITGHKTSAMVNHYGKKFARDKAAARAIDKIIS